MNEPDKDTAIEVTPETQPKQVRVPKIVAEINGVASCVRERNKNKDHDAEVLENVAPTQAKKTMEITRIIRENTHPRHSSANRCLRSLCFVGLCHFSSLIPLHRLPPWMIVLKPLPRRLTSGWMLERPFPLRTLPRRLQ